MQISDERLKEFQEAYKKDFGEDISIEEAREIASRLIDLYQLLAQPLPNEKSIPPSTEKLV